MDRNPFSDLYEIIREEGKQDDPSFFLAKITNTLPNIKIAFEGIELDKDNLMISKNLMIANKASVMCSQGSVSHNLKDTLSIGDNVLIYKLNDNIFIILDKVVSL